MCCSCYQTNNRHGQTPLEPRLSKELSPLPTGVAVAVSSLQVSGAAAPSAVEMSMDAARKNTKYEMRDVDFMFRLGLTGNQHTALGFLELLGAYWNLEDTRGLVDTGG